VQGACRFHQVVVAVALACAVLASPASAAEQRTYAAGMNYLPPTVLIGKGDTLLFNNLDAAAKHDIVSDDGRFASDLIANGQSGPVRGVETLDTGHYNFHCSLHNWMRGVVEVGAASPGQGGVDPGHGAGGAGGGAAPDPIGIWPQATPEKIGAGDWPMYGKDLANTRNGGTAGPPASQVADLGPAWSFYSHHGDFTGTPVVSRGILVVGSNGGTVYGLDATTGRPLWHAEAGGPVNGTVAISGKRVFVPVAKPHEPSLRALDLRTGRVLWTQTLGTQKDSDVYGSPVVWKRTVYIGTSAQYGETGDPEVSARGAVVALKAKTGKVRWNTYMVPEGHDGGSVWSTPAIDRETGRLYVGTGNAYHPPAAATTDAIVALDARSGQIVDHYQATPGDTWNATEGAAEGPDYDFGASPQLFDGPTGQKLVGEGQKSGTYWALDRQTMDPVWRFESGPGFPVLGGVVGSTATDGQRIYGGNAVGGERWAADIGGTPAWFSLDGGPLHFNPTAVSNGVVYSTDMNGYLTARDATTGLVLVKIPLGSPTFGGVSVAGGSVFAVTGTQGDSGYVVSYRVRRGDEPQQGARHFDARDEPEYRGQHAKKGKRGKKGRKGKRGKRRRGDRGHESRGHRRGGRKRNGRKRDGGRRGHQEESGHDHGGSGHRPEGKGPRGDRPVDNGGDELHDESMSPGGGPTRAVRERADRYVPKPPGTKQRLHLYYGPYTVAPGQDFNRVDLELPTNDGFLLQLSPQMRRADDLSMPTHQEAHIHHAHWYGLDPGNPEDNYFRGNAEWVFGNGDEQTRADFRKRSRAEKGGPIYGEFIRRGQPQAVIYMLHNKTAQPITVYIVLDVIWQDGTPEQLKQATGREFHDVSGTLFGTTYDVPRNPDGDGTHQYARDMGGKVTEWTAPSDGTLIGMGGHVHPGGKRVTVENYGSPEQPCRPTRGGYGGTVMLQSDTIDHHVPLSEDYQTEVTHPAWRAPLRKGDRIRISATYENRDHAWYEVMQHVGIYFDKKQPPKGHCKPYMVGGHKWKVTEGVPNHPWFHSDKFCGEQYGGPPCERPETGAPPAEVPTRVVNIANFQYQPGDRTTNGTLNTIPTINRGESLTFVNEDWAAGGVRHTATTCAWPCNGTYVTNYPLADGAWDSDELGYDPISRGDPTAVATTPPDLPAGTYSYFCRIHPWMRGAFRVK
jgi:polyvinyl alcohol dehydrogenase (cytochrome)